MGRPRKNPVPEEGAIAPSSITNGTGGVESNHEYVSHSEFMEFTKEVKGILSDVVERLEANKAPVPSVDVPLVDVHSSVSSDEFLPRQYQEIFEKFFDTNDGFRATMEFPGLDSKGKHSGTIIFTILVPKKFTNVSEAHWTYYKQDKRSRALMPQNIAKGIEDWCKLVSKNLHYKKELITK